MADPYSTRQFFRKVANKFLIDYFHANNIDFGIDLYGIYDHEVDIIFSAFKKLDEVTRHKIESDFQRVHALATDGGIAALIEEADEFDNVNFLDTIKSIWGLHNKSMFAYLDSPDYWHAASMFFQVRNIASSAWKVIKLPASEHHFEQIDIDLLSKAIGDYFFDKEGRGRRCKIEHYPRDKFHYFYAFPEDFAKSAVEWVSDTLQDIPHTMAFEIIFRYNEEENTLALYARKNTKKVPQLQQLFSLNILKSKITNFKTVIEAKKYDLDVLLEAGFSFVLPEDGDIFSVQLIRARSTSKTNPNSHITFEESPDNKNAIQGQLNELNLKHRYISEVTLLVCFFPKGNRTNKPQRVTITAPDKCSLSNFGDDLIIRDILTLSGIEPQPLNLSLACT